MGRLFWKFFIFIWLVQMSGMIAVGATFWLKRQAEIQQLAQFQSEGRPPPPHLARYLDRERKPHIPLIPLTATLIASLVAAALLARYFSRPIRSLRDAFDAASAGNLQLRLGPVMGRRNDELGDLGHDFDRMASQLDGLISAQRRLLHDVSHELRSPLARLQAAIGLARQQPDKLEATMDRVELESARIDHLVGELLTLSRLESGHSGNLDEDIDLDELLDDILENARFEAGLKQQQVASERHGGGQCKGNPEWLYRAIENVMRNAIKHSPRDSRIELQTALERQDQGPPMLRISVLDQGPGVPAEELPRLFDPFFRGSSAEGSEGYGLGLAIAKRALQAHHATLQAGNRAEGGLRVDIRLPLQQTAE